AALSFAQPSTIKVGTLIDGKGGVQKNVTVTINGSRIERIAPGAAGEPTYDLGNAAPRPGRIDTHRAPAGDVDQGHRPEQGREAPELKMTYMAGNALATLMAGFTTVQSVGDPLDGTLRDAINSGVLPGPRILTSLGQLNENSGDPATLREKIRKFKADGADV